MITVISTKKAPAPYEAFVINFRKLKTKFENDPT